MAPDNQRYRVLQRRASQRIISFGGVRCSNPPGEAEGSCRFFGVALRDCKLCLSEGVLHLGL